MSNFDLVRSYIRMILESPGMPPGGGHSLMTHSNMAANTITSPSGQQYTFEDTLDVDVEIFPTSDGKTNVKVSSLKDDKLSSPVHVFSNEEEARKFARDYVEKINRVMMAKYNR